MIRSKRYVPYVPLLHQYSTRTRNIDKLWINVIILALSIRGVVHNLFLIEHPSTGPKMARYWNFFPQYKHQQKLLSHFAGPSVRIFLKTKQFPVHPTKQGETMRIFLFVQKGNILIVSNCCNKEKLRENCLSSFLFVSHCLNKEKQREYCMGNILILVSLLCSLLVSRVNITWAVFSVFLHGEMVGAISIHTKRILLEQYYLCFFMFKQRDKENIASPCFSLIFQFFTKKNKDNIVWAILSLFLFV